MIKLEKDLMLLFESNLINFISEIISKILILIVFFVFYRILKKFIFNFFKRTNLDESIVKFITSISNIAVLIIIGLIVLPLFDVPVSFVIAIFSAIVVGVGISFKESFANLGAGIILLWSRQFKTGDYVSYLNTEGVVHGMNAFTVMLRTIDNKIITIPNSKLVSDTIVNFSVQKTRRMNIVFTLPYDVDITKAKKIVIDILEKEDRILKDPKYIVGVRNFTNNGVEIIVAPWVSTELYWDVYYSIMEEIVVNLVNNNIRPSYTNIEIINKVG